jgi:hypothetical protein
MKPILCTVKNTGLEHLSIRFTIPYREISHKKTPHCTYCLQLAHNQTGRKCQPTTLLVMNYLQLGSTGKV